MKLMKPRHFQPGASTDDGNARKHPQIRLQQAFVGSFHTMHYQTQGLDLQSTKLSTPHAKENPGLQAFRPQSRVAFSGAGNGIRTRDPNLGKVVLYQLSYSRIGEAR
jgi:hypothetical protein